jgi:hypothetical protein
MVAVVENNRQATVAIEFDMEVKNTRHLMSL